MAQDFSVSPSPLGTEWDLGLTGLGLGLRDLGFGTGLDNHYYFPFTCVDFKLKFLTRAL